jgi:hypothetical protein
VKNISRFLLLALLPVVFSGCTISKTATPNTVQIGQNLTFTIALNFPPSQIPIPFSFDLIQDTLPASVSLVSATTDSGECSPPVAGDNTVTCLVFAPSSGGTATVTIVVSALECGTFTNTASAFDLPDGIGSLSAEQLSTLEQLSTPKELPSPEQLTQGQLSAQQIPFPTIEDSASFTVECPHQKQQQQQQQQQQQGAPAPIIQNSDQNSQSGDSSQTFNVS